VSRADDDSSHRAGPAKPAPTTRSGPVAGPKERKPDGRARFASEIAGAEFGRFYWNDRLDRQLRAAMQRKPRRKPDGGKL
jgi:hypothetical protein